MPVFALRHAKDFGVGDTLAMKQAIDFCVQKGFSLLQFLPIHETVGDHSPYNAISSRALSPAFLALTEEDVPGLEDPHRLFVLQVVGDHFDKARNQRRAQARLLGATRPNPAFMGNRCFTVLVEDAVQVGDLALDDTEELEVVRVPRADVARMVREGAIDSALVLVAFHLYELTLRVTGPAP